MTTKTLEYVVSVYTYADKSYAAALHACKCIYIPNGIPIAYGRQAYRRSIHQIYFQKHETLTQE